MPQVVKNSFLSTEAQGAELEERNPAQSVETRRERWEGDAKKHIMTFSDKCHECQLAPNPPEFAQPELSRSNGSHPQRERTNLGVLFKHGWYCPAVTLQIWVCLICVMSPYSNGAVQIQVGLELADCATKSDKKRHFPRLASFAD